MYNSTLILLGIVGPIEAAKFVGRNGDTIATYITQVSKLKDERNITDALQKATSRQRMLEMDRQSIMNKALEYIASVN